MGTVIDAHGLSGCSDIGTLRSDQHKGLARHQQGKMNAVDVGYVSLWVWCFVRCALAMDETHSSIGSDSLVENVYRESEEERDNRERQREREGGSERQCTQRGVGNRKEG